jgi:hypothetical protein
MRVSFAALIGVVWLSGVHQAFAGNCMPCTDTSECRIADPAAFCVRHDSDPGCGQLQICCPGQACALETGTGFPTCYTAGTCQLVIAQVDAGDLDVGASDGASSDSGAVSDASGVFPDARTSTRATGPTSSSNRGGRDCSCSETHEAAAGASLASLLFVALALGLRRRP